MPLTRDTTSRDVRKVIDDVAKRSAVDLTPGSTMVAVVLGCTNEMTTVLDVASEAIVRWRIPWPAGTDADLAIFDVVEGQLASDIQRTDLALPEAISLATLPRRLGTYGGRKVRDWLEAVRTPADGPLFGFRGPSAPYWEFRGEKPSVALIVPDRGPQLMRRHDDGSTWVRFGWLGDDIWLLCEDAHAIRTIEATRRASLSGKELATALGFRPTYLLVTLSPPIDGHCYKSCTGILAQK